MWQSQPLLRDVDYSEPIETFTCLFLLNLYYLLLRIKENLILLIFIVFDEFRISSAAATIFTHGVIVAAAILAFFPRPLVIEFKVTSI